VSWQPKIIGSGTERVLNVTVTIANFGPSPQNFTITLYWEALIPVAAENVTDFPQRMAQSFTLAAEVAFDPTVSHYVGVRAGSAWVSLPIYRPPGYGLSNRPWWDQYWYVIVGLAVSAAGAIALTLSFVERRR
jgi:hypothetical protein